MLVRFFLDLRSGGVPVTLPEFLALLEALDARVASLSAEDFYHLARVCLVKDERHYDRFDRVFAEHFKGAEKLFEAFGASLPAEWLRALAERVLTEEEKAQVQALGGWDKLMETLRQRLAEQQERHEGGSKWIGTGGTSPFGAFGYNPEGVRIGQGSSRHRRAVKVWDRRDFANFDDTLELGTRNFKMGLRRLRRFAREGAAEELDLDGTIAATARNAGYLDLKLVPERRNAVKVLLLLDVGGSMDDHVRVCDELFSAARSEFRHFEHFYFHNFPYESLWKDNRRRQTERIATDQLIRTYGPDYRVIFVGDATMSPYEITMPGGSVEHWNAEAGVVWLQRLTAHFRHFVWLNPEPVKRWDYTPSIAITHELVEERMYPLTLAGLDRATAELRRRGTAAPPAAAGPNPSPPP
ncbi:MAG TPA: VWA domain-containing protein [Steroidobacteraceae bacterium]|nr:VWA domain-containing protein [Steroidobacteraceae bacterium]